MSSHPTGSGGLRRGAWFICAALVAALWGPAPARAAEDDPRLLIGYDAQPKHAKEPRVRQLGIRPNVEEPVFLFVKLPGSAQEKATVNVEILVNNKPLEGASATLTLTPGETQQVVFGKKKAPAPKEKEAGPPKKEEPPKPKEVPGPAPYKFEIRLSQVTGQNKKTPEKKTLQTLPLRNILSPLEYVDLVSSTYDEESQTLKVVVQARANFAGPRCPVKLVLPADQFLPPPRGKERDSYTEGDLRKAGDQLEFYVKALRARPGVSRDVEISLNVDGYDRALVIRQRFSGSNTRGTLVGTPSVRLIAPPLIELGKPLPIRFQVDYGPEQAQRLVPPDSVVLQFLMYQVNEEGKRLGRLGYPAQFPPGPRFQQLSFAPQVAGGALLFKTVVKEWDINQLNPDDLKGLTGKRYIQARLIDTRDNKVIQAEREGEEQGDRVRINLEDGRTVEFVKKVPSLVKFVRSKATKGTLGETIRLQARPVANFKITKVSMFLGKPDKDQAPKGAQVEEAYPVEDQEDLWEAELTLPANPKAKTAVVGLVAEGNFVDGPPMKSSDSWTIPLVAAPPPAPAVGKIVGTVTMGLGDNRLPQAGKEVILYKVEKTGATKVDTTKTDKKGEFVFKDLAPGDYLVTSSRQVPNVKGKAETKVEAQKTSKVEINLMY